MFLLAICLYSSFHCVKSTCSYFFKCAVLLFIFISVQDFFILDSNSLSGKYGANIFQFACCLSMVEVLYFNSIIFFHHSFESQTTSFCKYTQNKSQHHTASAPLISLILFSPQVFVSSVFLAFFATSSVYLKRF